ncbi:uncharacterized protein G2W53_017626 [Senna tora]|uniref:Uncharacterized protein n=1 Tax=Senna tora TaxID=362788 RepID=A0A834WKN6_9FABA|nr:uncharacterized protein G2W53_017626 [Senna tora]
MPYSPEKNGVAERRNRTLQDMMRRRLVLGVVDALLLDIQNVQKGIGSIAQNQFTKLIPLTKMTVLLSQCPRQKRLWCPVPSSPLMFKRLFLKNIRILLLLLTKVTLFLSEDLKDREDELYLVTMLFIWGKVIMI